MLHLLPDLIPILKFLLPRVVGVCLLQFHNDLFSLVHISPFRKSVHFSHKYKPLSGAVKDLGNLAASFSSIISVTEVLATPTLLPSYLQWEAYASPSRLH